MPKFRKKPVVIEARQFWGGGAGPEGGTEPRFHEQHARDLPVDREEHPRLVRATRRDRGPQAMARVRRVTIDPRDGRMVIATLEGGHWVSPW
jgi:hypothetical protein